MRNRRALTGVFLVLVITAMSGATDAFGFSGRPELTFSAAGSCVGDSWSLVVTAAGGGIKIKIAGTVNGKAWAIPAATDDNGYFRLSGVFGADAVGKNTVWVEDEGYGASPAINFDVVKCDVYVMGGGDVASDQAVLNALTARGYVARLGVQSWQWDGSQKNLKNYRVVVLLSNFNYVSPDMPATGQRALVEFVSQGGGMVTGEWLTWNIAVAGKANILAPIIPAVGGPSGEAPSATYAQAQEDAALNNGLPRSFSFSMNTEDGSESFLAPKNGSSVFYTSGNHGGLIGWDYRSGRVISFSSLLSQIELTDSNYARLFVNAVDWAAQGQRRFSIPDRGATSLQSSGGSGAAVAGYARIQPLDGGVTPSGLAILGWRQNGILVSETAIAASPLIQSARIHAEVNGPVNTALAIANPNDRPAIVSFYFTDASGDFGQSNTTIPANGQIAAFLNESPFGGPSQVSGTLTLSSSVSIAVLALRGWTNERSEFLATAMPVIDLNAPARAGPVIFPHFAEGGGWTTQIVLVNPTDTALTGTLEFRGQSGQSAHILPAPELAYSVAAHSSQKLQASSNGDSVQVGSMRLVPSSNSPAPAGTAIVSFYNGVATIAQTALPAAPVGYAFRLYAEASGDFNLGAAGSIQTGFVIANGSASPAIVSLELNRIDSSPTGLTGSISIPGNGQTAMFLNQIPGFDASMVNVQGILRVSSTAPISVVGVHGRYNERGDFLFSTTPPSDEAAAPSTLPLYFPHILDSGGYTTRFILFPGQPGPTSLGAIHLLTQTGATLFTDLQ